MNDSSEQPLQRLAEHGQSVWIDYLSRELLDSGELGRLVREDAVVGVTSNEPTLLAFQDHGRVADTLADRVAAARNTLERLAEVGVDYDDVVETLEAEGIDKFKASSAQLLAGLEKKTHGLPSTVGGRP